VKYCIQIDAASAAVRPGGAGNRIRAGPIAFAEARDASPKRLDRSDAFVTDQAGELRLHRITARPIHRLGTVEANRFNTNPHLARARIADGQVFDLKYFGTAELMDTYDFGHDSLFSRSWPSMTGEADKEKGPSVRKGPSTSSTRLDQKRTFAPR
jgi:hypothetical protein